MNQNLIAEALDILNQKEPHSESIADEKRVVAFLDQHDLTAQDDEEKDPTNNDWMILRSGDRGMTKDHAHSVKKGLDGLGVPGIFEVAKISFRGAHAVFWRR